MDEINGFNQDLPGENEEITIIKEKDIVITRRSIPSSPILTFFNTTEPGMS
jgi:hypothetical protein